MPRTPTARGLRVLIPALCALALAACDGAPSGEVKTAGAEGRPLSELDTTGPVPQKLVIAGPDSATVQTGERLAIAVSGDPTAVAALRFAIKDDVLTVTRASDSWKVPGRAEVAVTMPAPRMLTLAGSGRLRSAAIAPEAEIVVAGSGRMEVADVTANRLEVTLAGSGALVAAGTARTLELTIGGTGTAAMPQLAVSSAEVTIAGSGSARFASEGTVEANILGSGEVTVTGGATCTAKAMGTGRLVCGKGAAAAR